MKFLKRFLAKRVLPRAYVLIIDVMILMTSVFIMNILWNSYAADGIKINELLVVLPILVLFNITSFII